MSFWGSLCVYSWTSDLEEDFISIFEAAPGCLEDVSLSILARGPHKELCMRKPARPEERAKDVSYSEAEGQLVRDEAPK